MNEAYDYFGCNTADVFIIGINDGETNAAVSQYYTNLGLDFPAISGVAGGTSINNTYQVGAYPTYCLIAPDHSIVLQDIWPISSAQTFINAFEGFGIQETACGSSLTADFSADNLTPGIGETVNFTDLSTNSPYAWDWSFTPSTVTYVGGTSSASQNPQVQFNSDGYYAVSLTATNIDGSDSEVKLNYISVIGPTVADFTADVLAPGIGQTVSFTDLSSYDPTSWSWSVNPSTVTFVGGTNSSSQNPQVQFNNPELYTVSLTATNIYGSDTETKLNYIDVSLYCPASGASQYIEITRVQLETIDNETGQDYYSNFTYLSTDLTQDQSYDITITNGDNYPDADLSVWIDWNQDGTFNSTDEHVVCEVSNGAQGTYNFTVPVAATTGSTRMRVRSKFTGDNCGDPCGTTTYGEVEDYSVNVISGIVPPVANFVADNVTPTIGETVYFTDLSTNSPTAWVWTFTPSTVTYIGGTNSTSQNPEVQFDAAGDYTVALTATNSGGSDSETKLNYINVTIPNIDLELTVFLEGPFSGSLMNTDLIPMLPLNQPYNVDPWYYAGAESVVAIPGDIVDWVLVELRDATAPSLADGTTSFDWQAGFIRNDGKVVDIDGNLALHFESAVSNSLYVVVHHLNHLSIMTAIGVAENDGMYSYDFSGADGQAYGTAAQKLIGTGVWGMYGGDGNRDGTIDVSDRSPLWESEAGTSSYLESDYNRDGQSNNQDKNDCWLPNDGQSKQVPD